MKKKVTLFLIISLVAVFGSISCTGSNTGRIRGLDGGRYTAHFFRRQYRCFGSRIVLINDLQELKVWREKNLQSSELAEVMESYSEKFFDVRQLILIEFWGGSLEFGVERVSYDDNVLTVELQQIVPWGVRCGGLRTTMEAVPRIVVLEITRISDDLDIELIVSD